MKRIFAVLAFLLVSGFTSSAVYADGNSKQTVFFNPETYEADLNLLVEEKKTEEAVVLATTAFRAAYEEYQKPFDAASYKKKVQESSPGRVVDIDFVGQIYKRLERETLAEYSHKLGITLALNHELDKAVPYLTFAVELNTNSIEQYREALKAVQSMRELLKKIDEINQKMDEIDQGKDEIV